MKKLIFLASVVLTLASHAAYEKIALVRLADITSVTNAAGILGGHLGSPGLDGGIAAACEQSQTVRLLGPQRKGAPSGAVLYIPADGSVNVSNFSEKVQTAALHPATISRADFLAQHKDEAVETNGVIRLAKVNELDCLVVNYVAYTKDGLWASFAPNAELASAALQEVPRLRDEPFEGAICDFIATGMEWAPILTEVTPQDRAELESVEAIKVGLRADEKGLDIRCKIQMKKDSALARQTSVKLKSAALAFADKNALFAAECAAGGEKMPYPTLLENTKRVLSKNGYKLDALVLQVTNNITLVTLDVPRLIADNKGGTNNVVAAMSQFPQRIWGNLGSLTNGCAAGAASNAVPSRIAFTLKDAKGMYSPAERFAAVLPEAKGKPLFSAFAGSFYGLGKVLAAQCVLSNKENDEMANMASFMLAALPPAELDGTAGAYWCEGETLYVHYRISAGELKGVSSLIKLFAGLLVDTEEEAEEEFEEEPNEN